MPAATASSPPAVSVLLIQRPPPASTPVTLLLRLNRNSQVLPSSLSVHGPAEIRGDGPAAVYDHRWASRDHGQPPGGKEPRSFRPKPRTYLWP